MVARYRCVCCAFLTAKYNIKYNNNDCLKAFFGTKIFKSILLFSCGAGGGLRPKRKVGFIFIIEPYVLLTQWLDPSGALQTHGVKEYTLATDVHVEQQH